jgi:hypothetical protein
MDPMSSAVAVLTAMITPAVLISACGSMILSTSHRLGRVVDRVRALSDKLDELFGKGVDETKDRQAIIFAQLDKLTSRARILQRANGYFLFGAGNVCGHQRGDWRRGIRAKQATLQYGAGYSWPG